MAHRPRLLLGLVLATLAAVGPRAQEAEAPLPLPILIINQERLLTESRPGQALLAEEEAAREELRARARSIDDSFREEERRLTALRPDMDPAEFQEMADAFDAEVVRARREQDQRSDAMAQQFDLKRRQFYARVAPILVSLMSRYGALAIFDQNSVLLADQALNITEQVIEEINVRLEADDAAAGEGAPGPGGEAGAPPDAAEAPAPAAPGAPAPVPAPRNAPEE
jgi:Skp family chaperone for outer membrane proteins